MVEHLQNHPTNSQTRQPWTVGNQTLEKLPFAEEAFSEAGRSTPPGRVGGGAEFHPYILMGGWRLSKFHRHAVDASEIRRENQLRLVIYSHDLDFLDISGGWSDFWTINSNGCFIAYVWSTPQKQSIYFQSRESQPRPPFKCLISERREVDPTHIFLKDKSKEGLIEGWSLHLTWLKWLIYVYNFMLWHHLALDAF